MCTALVWLLGHVVLAVLVHDALYYSDVITASRQPRHRRQGPPRTWPRSVVCGDDLCTCDADGVAVCDWPSDLCAYIPALPETVRELVFTEDTLDPRHCNKTWGNDFFLNVTRVTELHVDSFITTSINPDALKLIKNLTVLYLSARIGIDSLRNILSVPTLRDVRVIAYGLGPIPENVFDGIGLSRLEILHLQNSDINKTVNLGAFWPFNRLAELNLDNNDIREISTDRVLGLKQLDLSVNLNFCHFPITCNGTSSLFPELEYLSLKINALKRVEDRVCLPKLKFLDVSQNPLNVIAAGTFSDQLFPSLAELNIDGVGRPTTHLPFLVTLHKDAFQNRMLRNLSIRNNNLDFSNPFVVHDEAFANCPRLSKLVLNGNNFYHVFEDRFLRLFRHLQLTIVDISDSKFDFVSMNAFQHFPHLYTLILRLNRISAIPDGAFDPLSHLHTLDLSKNQIANVNKNTFNEDTQKRLRKLSLSDNPFVCSCDLLWFKSWLTSSPSVFSKQYMACKNIPGTTVRQFSISEQACLLSREASTQIVVSCGGLILALTLTSLVFRHRWHLRLLMYEAFRGRGDARRQRLVAGDFDYDVFVSYASEDLPWVRERLMPELEDHVGLKLCVHERDFIPGQNIVDNIAECVESSKKILMVFSRDFVRSQWCQFELTFCLSHVMAYEDALLVVCVDDVASRDMTSAMMAVLKTTTYIQWEEAPDAVGSFWGRLQLALQEVIEQLVP